jgi:hypothetical protein
MGHFDIYIHKGEERAKPTKHGLMMRWGIGDGDWGHATRTPNNMTDRAIFFVLYKIASLFSPEP